LTIAGRFGFVLILKKMPYPGLALEVAAPVIRLLSFWIPLPVG
jgi:hypothetical protein